MTDTNIATIQPKAPIVVLRERLIERRSELKNALSEIDPDHFIRAVVTAAQLNPDILACSFQSVWLACMRACRDNLLPDGKEGVIVAFKSTANWIPMYQGLLKKFRQSGQAKWIGADVVRQGERFEHWVDEHGEHFKHVPGDDESAPIIRTYAAATTKDGGFYIAVMSEGEMSKIRQMSRASRDDSPWSKWTNEMRKKTALRRLSKVLPSGRDIFDDDEEPAPFAPVETPAAIERKAPQSAAASLDAFAGKSEPESEPEPSEDLSVGETTMDARQFAYDRGKKAKADGMQLRAIPGEYRNDARAAEAAAWIAGWNGEELADVDQPKTDQS